MPGSVYKRVGSDLDPSRPIIVVGLAIRDTREIPKFGLQIAAAVRDE